jgi:hypothetical protein
MLCGQPEEIDRTDSRLDNALLTSSSSIETSFFRYLIGDPEGDQEGGSGDSESEDKLSKSKISPSLLESATLNAFALRPVGCLRFRFEGDTGSGIAPLDGLESVDRLYTGVSCMSASSSSSPGVSNVDCPACSLYPPRITSPQRMYC